MVSFLLMINMTCMIMAGGLNFSGRGVQYVVIEIPSDDDVYENRAGLEVRIVSQKIPLDIEKRQLPG